MSNNQENPLPPRFKDHFALQAKDLGSCRRLTGDNCIVLIFVSTPAHPWTDEMREKVFQVSRSSVKYMQQEAKRYGAQLRFSLASVNFSIPFEHNRDKKWYYHILKERYHTDTIVDAYNHYKQNLKKNATIIFLFNSWEISYTCLCSRSRPNWKDEFCVIFCDTKMHDNYLTHEVMHLYGAIDFYDYRKEGVAAVARQLFPDSNMLKVSHVIDDLTAYIVGWTDQLSPKAIEFLEKTRGLR